MRAWLEAIVSNSPGVKARCSILRGGCGSLLFSAPSSTGFGGDVDVAKFTFEQGDAVMGGAFERRKLDLFVDEVVFELRITCSLLTRFCFGLGERHDGDLAVESFGVVRGVADRRRPVGTGPAHRILATGAALACADSTSASRCGIAAANSSLRRTGHCIRWSTNRPSS